VLTTQAFKALQLPDVEAVPAKARMAVFLNPGNLHSYFNKYGAEGVSALFSGIDHALIRQWAQWFGEVLAREQAQEDKISAALKDALDEKLKSNPAGPLSDMQKED
jgi:hypothetical protein